MEVPFHAIEQEKGKEMPADCFKTSVLEHFLTNFWRCCTKSQGSLLRGQLNPHRRGKWQRRGGDKDTKNNECGIKSDPDFPKPSL